MGAPGGGVMVWAMDGAIDDGMECATDGATDCAEAEFAGSWEAGRSDVAAGARGSPARWAGAGSASTGGAA